MRGFSVMALVAACGFTPGRVPGDGGGSDDGLVLPEGEHWVFETDAEFGAVGHSVDALTVEAPGSLTQVGYTYGGLLMYGLQDIQFWAVATPTIDFSATEGAAPTGTALWDTEFVDTNASLVHAGVTNNNMFSIWFEGEVFLDANDIVSLQADAAGFVDVKLPTGWIHLEARNNGLQVLPAVTAAGWYEVRLGWGEGTGMGFFDFRRGPSGTAVHYSRNRLRAPTSKLRGTMREVFFRQVLGGAAANGGAPVMSLEPRALLATTAFNTTLPGAGGNDDWSARWYGQFYAAVAGTYSLRIDSNDGNQLMFAGGVDNDHWARNDIAPASQSTVMADVAVGWHDLVLDYNQVDMTSSAALQVVAAPETAVIGMPVPRDRLRPVEPRRERLVSRTLKTAGVSIPNNAAGPKVPVAFSGLPNEVVTSIDITIDINTQHLDQLQFLLQPPGAGAPILMQDHPAGGGFNGHHYLHVTTPGIVGAAVDGVWLTQAQDNTAPANVTSISEMMITIHTSGGPGQIATTSEWISPVRDAGAAPVRVVDVVWAERATIASEVFVRGCMMADCSDNPDWGPALGQHGTAELASGFMQTKVVLHSDGSTETSLETLAITYRN